MPPDYVEACQWLILAAESGNKVYAINLRIVKARLSPEQLKEAEARANAIKDRLEAKEEEAKKLSAKLKP